MGGEVAAFAPKTSCQRRRPTPRVNPMPAAALRRLRVRRALGREPLRAARVAQLAPDARADAVARLLREPGPREPALHLALLQAAEAAAPWSSSLPEELVAEIAGRLMALFVEKTPNPILDRVAP